MPVPARAFHMRPLAASAAALGVGVALGEALSLSLWIPGLLACAFALTAAFLRRRKALCLALAALACLAVGMLRVQLHLAALPKHDIPEGFITARVDNVPRYTPKGWRVQLSEVQAGGAKVGARALLTVSDPDHTLLMAYGDTVLVQASLERPSPRRNPGGQDMRLSLAAQGYGYQLYARPAQIALQRGDARDFKGFVLRLRSAMERSLYAAMRPDHAGTYRAILFGDTSLIPDDTYDAFRETGITHLLSVSGLHVGGLAMIFALLLTKLKCSPMAVFGGTCAVLLLYCAMAGFSPPVSRTALMVVLMLLGRAVGRRTDMLTSLMAAFGILLLINPMQLFDIGFQLSFGAVFGLLTLTKPLLRLMRALSGAGRVGKWVANAVAATLAATIATLPTIANTFGELSLSSIPANIVVVPFSAPLVVLGLAAALLGLLWLPAGVLMGQVCSWLLEALLACVGFLRRWGMLQVPMIPLWMALGLLALCMLVSHYCLLSKRNRVAAALAALLAVSGVLASALRPLPLLEVTVLDVGQGNSAIVRAGRRTLLIDTGDARDYDYGERVVWPALRSMGIARLDAVMLTHAHSDHAGGLPAVLSRVRTDLLLMPETPPDEAVNAVLSAAAANGVPVSKVSDAVTYDLGQEVFVDIVRGRGEDANEMSLAFLLRHNGPIMLMTGDMGLEQEEALSPLLSETPIIEAGHHGSRYATGETLLGVTRPRLAVISVGRNNYGHPHPDTLARLADAGATVLRTDQRGAVTLRITTDGIGYAAMLEE